MEEKKPNGIARASDFRRLAEQQMLFEEPERVSLPASGLAVTLRRPRPVFWSLMQHPFPQDVAARVAPAEGEEKTITTDDLLKLADFWVEVYKKVFVEPELSLTPGPSEIDPRWLLPGDVEFIQKWAVGQVASDGSDLGRFRRGLSRPVAPAGADGEDVQPEAQLPDVGQGSGLPN